MKHPAHINDKRVPIARCQLLQAGLILAKTKPAILRHWQHAPTHAVS